MNPSYGGGANWGGVAIDPDRQIAVVRVNQIPAIVRLIPRDQIAAVLANENMDDWQISRQTGTPYYMARRVFLSMFGFPCTKPPWGIARNLEGLLKRVRAVVSHNAKAARPQSAVTKGMVAFREVYRHA